MPTIPAAILTGVKDLLRIPAATATYDTLIQGCYDVVLTEFAASNDVYVEVSQINAVGGTDIYTMPSNATRIVTVLHNLHMLQPVKSRTTDWMEGFTENWNGRMPENYLSETIPPSLDGLSSVSPDQIAILPPPDVDASADDGLTILNTAVPTTLPVQYTSPYLMYRTASAVARQMTDVQDINGADFWQSLADLWKETIEALVP